MAQDYKDLIVWQKAIDLILLIYKVTQDFPKSEIYGLSSQMRRASVSVASNIAEGRGRLGPGEFRQFLGLARGSTCELLTQIHVAKRLEIGDSEILAASESLCNEVSKMLLSFIQKLDKPSNQTARENRRMSQAIAG